MGLDEVDAAGYRLSPQQRRLWRLLRLNAGREFVTQCCVLIEGPLDEAILNEAIQSVVQKHEILRTTFRCLPGVTVPVQVTHAAQRPAIRQHNPSGSVVAKASSIEQVLAEDASQPVDLAHDPLLQVSVMRADPRCTRLFLTVPSLCADRTGLANLVQETGRYYAARVRGDVLEDEPLQYADLAEWLNQLLETEDTEAGRTYWKSHRHRLEREIGVPYPREPIEGGFHARAVAVQIDPKLGTEIRQLSGRLGVSVSVLLLSTWRVLLGRLSGQAEITIGTSFDGRNYEQLEGTIGLFARYLPLRCLVDDDVPFSDVVRQVGDTVKEISEWQEYFNWEDMLDAADDIEHAYYPLGFDFAEIPPILSVGDDTTFGIDHLSACTDQFRIKLASTQWQDTLSIDLHYDDRYYAEGDMERLASQLQALLTSVTKQPTASIGDLDVVGEAERHRLLVEWNRPDGGGVAPDICVPELFEAQAGRCPDAVAVVSSATTLDFRELNARANQLARYLKKAGVCVDTRVGLCVERSPETIVALLGILKAGGAYVPLDPGYPPQRLAYMIEDAGISLLLTQHRLRELLPQSNVPSLCLDTNWEVIGQESRENLLREQAAESLAYVIYTSGSTGRPKGVMVSHRGLAQYLSWSANEYRVTEGRGAPLHSPLGFDLTITSIFPHLLAGQPVTVLPEDLAVDELGSAFGRTGGFSLLKITPSHLTVLGQQLTRDRIPSLAGALVVGGEALHGETLTPWQTYAPSTRIINEYGPTEAVVGCCIFEVPAGASAATGSGAIPIGKPTPGTQLYTLNSRMKPVPMGAAGELYIGGAQLARGYLGRPDATAASFVPDAYGGEAGARLYKTADLARFRADANLEFLGRVDHQVKVRGFRIELGEIEAVLGEQPNVRHSVVIAREDTPGDVRLVAYLVAAAGTQVADIRARLTDRLPDYMIPAAFVTLESLPLTPNGKVDRAALPPPNAMPGHSEAGRVKPRNPYEEMVANQWSHLLRVDNLGIHDNFFDLGGHSLLATQVLTRLNATFHIKLSYRDLFDAPTVAGLAERVEAEVRRGEGVEAPPLRHMSRDQDLPLSFAQERLWLLDKLEQGTAYHISWCGTLKGPVNVAALEQVLGEIVRRHEALRTTFATVDGRARQVISRDHLMRLSQVDVTGLSGADLVAEGRRLHALSTQRPFDLSRGPLLRATLVRTSDQEHLLLFTMHHIVSDAWSKGVLAREVSTLYKAIVLGRPSPFDELKVQYADYAYWQRQWLVAENLDSQIAYWKAQLSGAPPALELPTDRPRPAVQTFNGALVPVHLPPDLSKRLADLGRGEGATVFMTLLAAFQAMLHRLTGQPDVVVGTPLAGRTHSDSEDLIGFFVNTLAMRADLGRDPTFVELLAQVRKVSLEAYAHQDLPFEKLVNELDVERDLGRTPLFQAMFVLQNAPGGPIELAGLRLEPLDVTQVAAKFDLTLYLEESQDGIKGSLEYNTDLFDATTIERMAGHFEALIAGVVADPDRRISEVALLSDAERAQLLVEWNDTTSGYPRDETTPALFEAQVARTPDTVAVVDGVHHVTYRELNARANRLARHVRALGVGPEHRVGLCMKRSAEMVAGVLGVLKAGGTYVGIDPAYPPNRIAFMIGDSNASVMVTETDLADRLPEHQGTTLNIDADAARIARYDATNPVVAVGPDCLSHVIYTSGSTGVPKGVAIEHRSVTTLVRWSRDHYSDADLSGVLASTSVCFDLSVWELFVPLSWGGTVVMVENALALETLPAAERVTLINTVPSAIAALLREDAIPASVRTINLAGEPLTASLADTLHAVPTIQRVCDLYGPSEDTTYSTYASRTPGGRATIGQPLADTQAYVLGAGVDPVPVGVPGELHIGGRGLARGYLNRPDLTAERFVPDPFAAEPGSRVYRTGDRMRWFSDGTLEFLGRIDHQVKIRGFRIELGEIEAALREHPAVRETVVTAREDTRGQRRLVAYLVAHAAPPGATELRTYLKASLPDYMVPTEFVTLDALPLTPNGKVDRRALPAPEQTRAHVDDVSVAPSGLVETTLANIWRDVLSLERVGVHDNFFHVGGDSIVAIQIVVRANQAGLKLTPKQIFEYQTIAELAAVTGEGPAVAAEQGVVTGPVALTPIQRWFFDSLPVDAHHFNQAVLLEARVPLNRVHLQQAVEALVLHHDVLRHHFTVRDGEWRQESAVPDGNVPLSSVDLSSMPPAERRAEMARTIDTLHASFDLGNGPLFRACHFAFGDEPDRLFLVAHHLVVDGVSWRTLLVDLWSAYERASRGSAVTLPPKTTAFQHWAGKLHEYAQGAALTEEVTYWRQMTGGVPPLPMDRTDGSNTVASRSTVSTTLTEPETQALLTDVPEAYGTQVNDVLLTALLQAFAEWTGSPALVIDLEGHGREELFNDVDVSRTVGWFTTLYPVRLELPANGGSGDALRAIKEQLRAIPQRGIGYGLLRYVRESAADAQFVGAAHAAEVRFNYLGQFDQTLPGDAPFRFAAESSGREQSGRAARSHLLDVVGMIIDKQLRVSFQFSENLHRRETMQGLAERFGASLRGVIEHCLSPEAGGASPSDFPLADLDQATLDRLLQGQQS